MGKYRCASDSLRKGQLDELLGKIADRDIIDRLRDSQPKGTSGGLLLNDAADEIAALKARVRVLEALQVKFFPQRDAYDLVRKLEEAGFGRQDDLSPYGNTLIGMVNRCLDDNKRLQGALEKICKTFDQTEGYFTTAIDMNKIAREAIKEEGNGKAAI